MVWFGVAIPRFDVKKVADPEGGERAIITLNGKHLPAKPF